jgi:hypothetical protein
MHDAPYSAAPPGSSDKAFLGAALLMPQSRTGVVFRIRVDGDLHDVWFKNLAQAETAAQGYVAPRKRVEIIEERQAKIICGPEVIGAD